MSNCIPELISIPIPFTPFFPLRVVTTIAPLAPSGPNRAAACGPCNTEISSISSGLISLLLAITVPSTTYNGPEAPPPAFDSPLILIFVSAPNAAEDWLRTWMPDTLPASALLMLVCLTVFNCSALTTCALEEVALAGLLIPKAPVTTTSFKVPVFSSIVVIEFCDPTETSSALKLAAEISRISPSFTFMV